MIPLRLEDVARATGGRIASGAGDLVVDAVTTDSREVPDGRALFVAIRGEHADGHDHLAGAVEHGAVAVLSEREVDLGADVGVVVVEDTWTAIARLGAEVRDRVDPFVVAITGSVGKTTTKDLTAAALGAGRRTVAAVGSFNNELGVPLTLLSLEEDSEALVVEIGARGVGHVAELVPYARPDVSIVTAVAGVHLELFGDIDAIAQAKGELVEGLAGDGTAVLNADDERVAAMAARAPGAVLRYGLADGPRGDGAAAPDLVASDVRLDRLARASFAASTPWGDVDVTLPVAGRHHVWNALAALAAAGVAGVPTHDAAAALATARISDWRGEVTEHDGLVVLNDAYNANPTSVIAALDMLMTVERTGRAVAVLGVMAEIGPTAEAEHERVGRRAAELGVDLVIAVGDDAEGIARGARAGGLPEDRVAAVDDAAAASALLAGDVGPGDVVLVKASRVGGLEAVADDLLADGRSGTRGAGADGAVQ
ncbi:MAG: UDP-N-acetylmuramoyl-tripeptide--D-alanyl-D-alanine ligase [Actinobacteria bacterium]|nr:UDP-N-acetylmuramoyl-tripeptide--D-alanyl-D-alanine ligase [Actinomycetota bacterium]